MEFSFAPLQGVTYSILRTNHARFFGGVDKYYAPFIAPDSTGNYKDGDMRDILPENNIGTVLIPQILANNPHAFLSVASELKAMGYNEINLNVGCPSGTVVAKHKGSGMLSDLYSLDEFLDVIFSQCDMKISVKTRMGIKSTDEFSEILSIYNKYPISQLIIHARSREGMYKSKPDELAYAAALNSTSIPVIYNGNAFTPADVKRIVEAAPNSAGIMIGRGACIYPAVFREANGGSSLEAYELREYHDAILSETLASGLCESFTVNRMKEFWFYHIISCTGAEKAHKHLVKARHLYEYKDAVNELFRDGEIYRPSAEDIIRVLG